MPGDTALLIGARARVLPRTRAPDSAGTGFDFLLSMLCDAAAAKTLFHEALGNPSHPHPGIINTGQALSCGTAVPGLKKAGTIRRGEAS